MHDVRLAKIESDVRGFVSASYPGMVVRAEYWERNPSRVALFFIEERFRDLYRRQRYHYLIHLIPKEYLDSTLANTEWFELAPNENPESIEDDADEDFIVSITPDVIGSLQRVHFFAALDELFLPEASTVQRQTCSGDFRHAKRALKLCGFEESDWFDVFHVLMGQGAFCDCEILFNVADESRLRAQYWKQRSHAAHP